MIFSATTKDKGLFFDNKSEYDSFVSFLKDDQKFEIKIEPIHSKRTNQQNNALHLFFQMVADALNDAGFDIRKVIKQEVDIPWTAEMIKEHLWRPIQKIYLKKVSTTELDKQKDIDQVYEIFNRHIAKFGIHIPFPSLEQLAESEDFLKEKK